MADNLVMLCNAKGFQGPWNNYTSDQQTLGPQIDRLAQSLGVHSGATPVAFYEGQNFGGASFVITQFGSIADLANPPIPIGNWANRIRSFRYLRNMAEKLTEGVDLGGGAISAQGDMPAP